MGWRVRHGIAGDIPFFATVLVVLGAVVAVTLRGVADLILHHHSTHRSARG